MIQHKNQFLTCLLSYNKKQQKNFAIHDCKFATINNNFKFNVA